MNTRRTLGPKVTGTGARYFVEWDPESLPTLQSEHGTGILAWAACGRYHVSVTAPCTTRDVLLPQDSGVDGFLEYLTVELRPSFPKASPELSHHLGLIKTKSTILYLSDQSRLKSPYLQLQLHYISWGRTQSGLGSYLAYQLPKHGTTCSPCLNNTHMLTQQYPPNNNNNKRGSMGVKARVVPSAARPTQMRTGPRSRILRSVGGYRTGLPSGTTVCMSLSNFFGANH
jgi:hypothetical protein